jgi:hypothetical protein
MYGHCLPAPDSVILLPVMFSNHSW